MSLALAGGFFYDIIGIMKGILSLRESLFWEKQLKNLDYQKDAQFIIGRVLDFGNLNDWKAIKDFYGIEEIKKVAKKHVFSNPKDINFWSVIFEIPLNKLKCTRNPLLKTPKAFLRQ